MMTFFLRLEIFGHYLEAGKTTEPETVDGPPDNAPQPMQVYTERLGFRVIGDGCDIATDLDA